MRPAGRMAYPAPMMYGGVGQATKLRDMEFDANLEREGKVPFELKLTLLVALLMIYPVIACARLTLLPSISYWFGGWMFLVVIFVPLWVLWMHLLLISGKMSKRRVLLLMTMVPSIVLAIACQLQAVQSRNASSLLLAEDCKSFKRKADLEDAWKAANAFKMHCLQGLSNTTGASIAETSKILNIDNCEGYDAARHQYKKQWAYLEQVEKLQHCGGWCHPATQIWTHNDQIQDSCSFAVAQLMDKTVRFFGTQVSIYTGLVLLCFCLILVAIPESWKKPVLGN
eukprot:gnl/TRDRNA2_/TRDRNA2_178819_c0_seq1.p1 gnl/TRDRNA2_/TRDRNA2_178819_c0~~gnl/TRDRNA2_/TRDRNA2_178819_c0_seq1.p1  ORF type:complete len:283 (-),score=59.67 gnl/TRDRNA2_/TRDRNA2_178819_c0_seq1:68-916(-)